MRKHIVSKEAAKEQRKESSKTETFYEAQRRKEIARADLREVELATKRNELVQAAERERLDRLEDRPPLFP